VWYMPFLAVAKQLQCSLPGHVLLKEAAECSVRMLRQPTVQDQVNVQVGQAAQQAWVRHGDVLQEQAHIR
jgi:hypothetical protein